MQKTLTFLPVVLAAASSLALVASASTQTNWEQRSTQATPAARTFHVLVHDPARGKTVMFGGHSLAVGNLGDTWEWDGTQWLERFPLHSPSPRHNAMACFDETRGAVIMFGGQSDAPYAPLGDTWEWDGVDWQLLASSGPSPRGQGQMAFDYANGWPVLFSGTDLFSAPLQDMWEFVNGTWRQRTPQLMPPPCTGAVFCADPRRREIVLQGGANNWAGGALGQCWIWNGSSWSLANSRGTYDNSFAAYDAIRRRIVAFGGGVQSVGADTWEWDGSVWTQRSPSQSPSSRGGSRPAFDTVSGRVLLFGGGSGNTYNNETWEYLNLSPARYENYGHGCPGTNLQSPQLDIVDGSLPWIGEEWSLEVRDVPAAPFNFVWGLVGTSRTTANGLPLPFDLGVIGMPGCPMLMNGEEATTLLTNVGGRAAWNIRFPFDLQLIGRSYYLQAVVLDPLANALGVTVSNGGDAYIGQK
ncbi:MAG: hypothetical protein HZB39_12105 [Planctomycetes bacterium]|nr:hypothetical protein [Planctomycetota bacterium]